MINHHTPRKWNVGNFSKRHLHPAFKLLVYVWAKDWRLTTIKAATDSVAQYLELIHALFVWRNSDRFLDDNGNRRFYQKQSKSATHCIIHVLDFDSFTGEPKFPEGIIVTKKSMIRRRATNLRSQPPCSIINLWEVPTNRFVATTSKAIYINFMQLF